MVLKDFQEDKAVERALYSWPIIALIVILGVLAFWGVLKSIKTEFAIKNDIKNLEQKIAEEKASQKNFEQKLSDLQNPEGLDKEARGRLNLKKPGEDVVLFLDDDSANVGKTSGGGVISSFWNFIKNRFGF